MKSEWHRRWCLLLARTASVGGFGASGGGAPSTSEASGGGSTVTIGAADEGSTAVSGVSIAVGCTSASTSGGGSEGVKSAGTEDGSSTVMSRDGHALPLGDVEHSGSSVRMHSSPASLMYTPHLLSKRLSRRLNVPRNFSDRSI